MNESVAVLPSRQRVIEHLRPGSAFFHGEQGAPAVLELHRQVDPGLAAKQAGTRSTASRRPKTTTRAQRSSTCEFVTSHPSLLMKKPVPDPMISCATAHRDEAPNVVSADNETSGANSVRSILMTCRPKISFVRSMLPSITANLEIACHR